MTEIASSPKSARTVSPIQGEDNIAAAGYVNPFHPIDENADHRRFNDGVLHWQRRPRVYPFGEQPNTAKSGKLAYDSALKGFCEKTSKLAKKSLAVCETETVVDASSYKNGNEEAIVEPDKNVSLYTSEFFKKPISTRKFRPSSLNRRNNPHPNAAFHVKHMLHQEVPVVRTKMTLEEFHRKPINSPYLSNSHRVYRKYDLKEIERVKPLQRISESVTGIVPELNKPDAVDPVEETRLFPVIPRNARLTADRAQGLANAVIKPRRNKYQPHLSDATSLMSGNSFPFRSENNETKPSLKRCTGYPDSIKSASWDGAPTAAARTTFSVLGRKKADRSKVEPAASTVVPELPPPTSKSLMFKEYNQFPKYAPQMVQEYYGGRTKKTVRRPYVF